MRCFGSRNLCSSLSWFTFYITASNAQSFFLSERQNEQRWLKSSSTHWQSEISQDQHFRRILTLIQSKVAAPSPIRKTTTGGFTTEKDQAKRLLPARLSDISCTSNNQSSQSSCASPISDADNQYAMNDVDLEDDMTVILRVQQIALWDARRGLNDLESSIDEIHRT